MRIIGIDPGPPGAPCGWVVVEGDPDWLTPRVEEAGETDFVMVQTIVKARLASQQAGELHVAIEGIEARGGGQPVSQVTIDTAEVVGAMRQLCHELRISFHRWFPREIKRHVTGRVVGVSSSVVSMAIKDRYRTEQDAATSRTPWLLKVKGLKGHAWPALAVALRTYDRLLNHEWPSPSEQG